MEVLVTISYTLEYVFTKYTAKNGTYDNHMLLDSYDYHITDDSYMLIFQACLHMIIICSLKTLLACDNHMIIICELLHMLIISRSIHMIINYM